MIKNLKKDGSKFTWTVEEYDSFFNKGTLVEMETNNAGFGIFAWRRGDKKQIAGTCDFMLGGSMSISGARKKINRHFASDFEIGNMR